MTSAADEVRLGQFRGSNPVLLVFTPSADAPEYVEQRRALEQHRAELAGQHVTLLEVHGDIWGAIEGRPLSAEAVRKLRAQEHVPVEAFRVVLLDTNGTERLRTAKPLLAERLTDLLGIRAAPEEMLHAQ
ncbi:MAG: DUF4174 domain-containing protein [Myxococcaceae bacterium]|nr:DUF4174 domain-containing protein [Myxococcaceae bacterium]MCI0669101.1 DUF4174 domain-containing protein [Myxococcaceae bacterium]